MSNEDHEISHPTFKSKRRRDIPAAERREASRRGSWFAPVGAASAEDFDDDLADARAGHVGVAGRMRD